jgi:dCTP deaminase
MILSNEGIKQALKDGAISITPVPPANHYTTSAVDLTLSDDFRIWNEDTFTARGAKVELDLSDWTYGSVAKGYLRRAETERDGSVILPPFRVHPWHFLAQTREEIFLAPEHKLAARVEGRSSLARIGVVVHLTAPVIHSGFQGHITLEIINFGPFHLRLVPATTRICQLVFERLETVASGEPNTSFQGQQTPAGDKTADLK